MKKNLMIAIIAHVFLVTITSPMGSQAPAANAAAKADDQAFAKDRDEKIEKESKDDTKRLRSQMEQIEPSVGAKILSKAQMKKIADSLQALRNAPSEGAFKLLDPEQLAERIQEKNPKARAISDSDSDDDDLDLGDISAFKASLKPLASVPSHGMKAAAAPAPKNSNPIPVINIYAKEPNPVPDIPNFNDVFQKVVAGLSRIATDPKTGTSPVL